MWLSYGFGHRAMRRPLLPVQHHQSFQEGVPRAEEGWSPAKEVSVHVLLMDLLAEEVFELKELLKDMDKEDSPWAGPSMDADNDSDFL
jgi:hypothetical protein